MPDNIQDPTNYPSTIAFILSRTSILARAVFAFLIIISVSTIIFVLGYKKLSGNIQEVKFNREGTTIVLTKNIFRPNSMQAIFLLPSCDVWNSTGIILEPGQEIKISASGKVHLAIQHIVESGENNISPKTEWVSPCGTTWRNLVTEYDTIRKSLLLQPEVNIGALVACLLPISQIPSYSSRIPLKEISYLKSQDYLKLRNDSEIPKVLWLSINDILLFPNSAENSAKAFLGTHLSARDSALSHKWNEIKKLGCWDIFYKDNVGEYLVQIQGTVE